MLKKKKILIVLLPLLLLTLIINFSKRTSSVPSNSKAETFSLNKEAEIQNNNGNHAHRTEKPLDRLVKTHMLERKSNDPKLEQDSRNIFIIGDRIKTLEEKAKEEEEKAQEQAMLAEIQYPQFSYKVIGVVRIHRSEEYTKFAIVFNGFENLLVKEGDMIDPVFQLVRINEDDIDVRFIVNNVIIKVVIKGS